MLHGDIFLNEQSVLYLGYTIELFLCTLHHRYCVQFISILNLDHSLHMHAMVFLFCIVNQRA